MSSVLGATSKVALSLVAGKAGFYWVPSVGHPTRTMYPSTPHAASSIGPSCAAVPTL